MYNYKKIFILAYGLAFGLSIAFAQAGYRTVHILAGHEGEVQAINFSPNGNYIASGGQYGHLIIWDVQTGKTVRQINAHKDRINDVTFDPSGQLLATASYDGLVKVWKVATGDLLHTFQNKDLVFGGHGSKIISFVVFHPDGRHILFGGDGGALLKAQIGKNSRGGDFDPIIVYSTVTTDAYERKVADRITGGTWIPDGKSVVFCAKNTVIFVEVATGKVQQKMTYPKEWLNDVVAGPKEGQISVWSEDGMINVWDVEEVQIIHKITAGDYNDYCPIEFNASGSKIISGASGKLANIWEVATGNKVATLSGHTATVRVARFSPTEDLVATGSYDGTIRIWKPEQPEVVAINLENTTPMELSTVVAKVDTLPTKAAIAEEHDEIKEKELAVGKTFNLKSIQFEQGEHRLLQASQPVMNRMISLMKKYPNMVIQIEGHTDNMGDAQKNLTLSYRRVTTVRNYLLERGRIEEARILAQAFGESKPIASNQTEETRKLNRRVEIRILKM